MAQDGLKLQGEYRLAKDLAGIEILSQEGIACVGQARDLFKGETLLVCGRGFDEHTLKVLYKDRYYFVYIQQLSAAIERTKAQESSLELESGG